MPRSLLVGNARLTIALDARERIRDVFFPMVGLENHVFGHEFRIGVWVDGRFSWVGEGWEITQRYLPDTLVTRCLARSPDLDLHLEINDGVHHAWNVFLRKIEVQNTGKSTREIRLFFSQDFHLYGTIDGDTAMFEPESGGVVHYKRKRYFLINGETDTHERIYQFATGEKESAGREGSWKDAEDGELGGNPIAQGRVDSVIALRAHIPADSSYYFYMWMAAGENIDEVRNLDAGVKKAGVEQLLLETENFASAWVSRRDVDLTILPGAVRRLYKTSLQIMRAHVDSGGATIASLDSDIPLANSGTYAYVWPRDGALTALALTMGGFQEASQAFFRFCRDAISKQGFFYHKYLADGSIGSTWLARVDPNGKSQLPIQEDETALVLYSLWRHFQRFRDVEFIATVYDALVIKATEFMLSYMDSKTGLPKPSFDIWEERVGVFTATTATVCAALMAAAQFARVFFDSERRDSLNEAAEKLKKAMYEHLYDRQTGRFIRGIYADGSRDTSPDCSTAFAFLYGPFGAKDDPVEKTMASLMQNLAVKTQRGGIARYVNDEYARVSKDVPGNPWPICSLWLGRWRIGRASTMAELKQGMDVITWATDAALKSGVLAEQLNPYTGAPVGVSPLAWSHAEYVMAVCEYIEKHNRLVAEQQE